MIGTSQVLHSELLYLPKKLANFLHEIRAQWLTSLNLPKLSSDHSKIDVHSMLTPRQISALLQQLQMYSPWLQQGGLCQVVLVSPQAVPFVFNSLCSAPTMSGMVV